MLVNQYYWLWREDEENINSYSCYLRSDLLKPKTFLYSDTQGAEALNKVIKFSNFLSIIVLLMLIMILLSGILFPKPTLEKLFDSYVKGNYLFTLQDNNSTASSDLSKLLNPDFVRFPVLYLKNQIIICKEVERQNVLVECTLQGDIIGGSLIDPNVLEFLIIYNNDQQKHLALFKFDQQKLVIKNDINIGNDDYLFYHFPNYYTYNNQDNSINIYDKYMNKERTVKGENRDYKTIGVVNDYLFAYDGRNFIDLLSKKRVDAYHDGVLDNSKVLMFAEDELIKFEYLFYDGKRIWYLDSLFSDYYAKDQTKLPSPVGIEGVTDGFSDNVVCTNNGVYVVELIGNSLCKFKLSDRNYKPFFGIMHNPFIPSIFSNPYKLYVLINYTSTGSNILAYSYNTKELTKFKTCNMFAKLNLNIKNISSFFVNEKIIGIDYAYKNKSQKINDFICFSEDKVFRIVEHGINSVFYGYNYLW